MSCYKPQTCQHCMHHSPLTYLSVDREQVVCRPYKYWWKRHVSCYCGESSQPITHTPPHPGTDVTSSGVWRQQPGLGTTCHTCCCSVKVGYHLPLLQVPPATCTMDALRSTLQYTDAYVHIDTGTLVHTDRHVHLDTHAHCRTPRQESKHRFTHTPTHTKHNRCRPKI